MNIIQIVAVAAIVVMMFSNISSFRRKKTSISISLFCFVFAGVALISAAGVLNHYSLSDYIIATIVLLLVLFMGMNFEGENGWYMAWSISTYMISGVALTVWWFV
ncbi:hypothetical protein HYV44_00870 [Candidatus Microgenomates bacterium]|nr:hypothetical protein [Candidatus Microgenomates bacterium]